MNLDSNLRDTVYINNDSVCSIKKYIYNHTVINNHAKLELKAESIFYKGVSMYIKSGGTLIVDSAIIRNAIIKLEPGSVIYIKNKGEIQLCKDYQLSFPKGSYLYLSNGSIN